MTLRGADPDVVRLALASGDPLPGTGGFAGELSPEDVPDRIQDDDGPLPADAFAGADGLLVRDVLGREPLYVDGAEWSLDPTDLDDPEPLPAGSIRRAGTTDDGAAPTSSDAETPTIRRVWTLPPSAPAASPGDALDALREAIDAALGGLDPATPVAFSGGVDSGLVASATDGPLYVAGFPESQDVEAARQAAAALDRDLREVAIDHDELERAVREVVAATGRTNAMDVAIAVPLYLVAECARADGADRLALGQGADECFGGYAKVAEAGDDHRLESETTVGARDEVLASLPEQLPRDVLAVRAAGVEPVTPLLDDRVVEAALALPPELLVDGDERKVALRQIAAERLPDSIANRDKKALQYGSLVSRELDRLARQAGFKRRMDDHVSQYVANLVEE